ncbi:hypothetical protein C5167_006383 [Papaver somniferum]|uniref:Uncharacterized protein n=1 Tax=Papaver somniferum TaxID=3469 RepID=A0A4Y7JGL9_PAPSO|nr:uncharacterized protein LOC113274198 [Papaver somniferum]RZC59081.1 hypothetical protein C5167_006383 [Papaver somniferum]
MEKFEDQAINSRKTLKYENEQHSQQAVSWSRYTWTIFYLSGPPCISCVGEVRKLAAAGSHCTALSDVCSLKAMVGNKVIALELQSKLEYEGRQKHQRSTVEYHNSVDVLECRSKLEFRIILI